MTATGPSPETRFPIRGLERSGFLRNFITGPNILVGDYTYYDDPRGPQRFEENVLYHFDFIGDRLVIGKFCSIAAETRFLTNGGNHPTTWMTTYPFPIFGEGWESAMPAAWPHRGDTVVRVASRCRSRPSRPNAIAVALALGRAAVQRRPSRSHAIAAPFRSEELPPSRHRQLRVARAALPS